MGNVDEVFVHKYSVTKCTGRCIKNEDNEKILPKGNAHNRGTWLHTIVIRLVLKRNLWEKCWGRPRYGLILTDTLKILNRRWSKGRFHYMVTLSPRTEDAKIKNSIITKKITFNFINKWSYSDTNQNVCAKLHWHHAHRQRYITQ